MTSRSQTVARLGDLTTLISSGSTPKGGSEVYLREGPVMLIRSQNVRMNELTLDDVAYVTNEIDAGMNRSRVQNGDVLLNITGASIGRVAAFELEDVRANVNQHVCIIRPKSGTLLARYLTHLISSSGFQAEIDRLQHGGTRQALTFTQIAEFKIPLPPLPEQRRIAEVLDRAEALRAKRREALALLDSLTQAIFLHMFGDPVENPKGVKVVVLADIATRITDGVHQKPNYTDGGVPFISVKDITTGELIFDDCKYISIEDHKRFTKRCRPERLDILYTKVGATYGRPAIVETDREFSIYVSVCIIKPRKEIVDPYFLNAALGTSAVKSQADRRIKGIGVPDLHLDQIQNFRIPLPPIGQQRLFVERVKSVEKLKISHRASLAELDTLFATLQHRAFRGEL